MNSTTLLEDAIAEAEKALGQTSPIVMVNLLRFYKTARYDKTDLPIITGREAYHDRYVPAFGKIAAATPGIKLSWLGEVHASLVKPSGEAWDEIALVEYPNIQAFRDLVQSSEYVQTADSHRRAALEDWRLIATQKTELPS